MSAREKNDLLLAAMKERGEASGQKVTLVMKPMTPEELAAKNLIAENLQKIENAKAEEKKKLQLKKIAIKNIKLKEMETKKKVREAARMKKQKQKQMEIDKKRKLADEQYGADGRTDYSRKRSRRKVRNFSLAGVLLCVR